MSLKIISTNVLGNHPSYPKIIAAYNEQMQKNGGRINNFKFFKEVISPLIPNYKKDSWYQFVRKFRTAAGLILIKKPCDIATEAENEIIEKLVSNEIATNKGINLMLNLGSSTLQYIAEHPEELIKLSLKDRLALLINAMKAQDSRIRAIKEIREDSREQAKFDRAFNEANFLS